ncbi:hypothetical protein F5X68DRAFT_261674 [Plectosphaerella plurivora]|uniref:Uncharacterized protein n=1 Tax=Plectosphaerella plurivora TaxID=936078 RepID=A0A9P8VBX9_9PEZI|nr:hypothetical protein F5X68DRAFT_261674 [Plectosphaerella plurivora]
MAEPIRLIVCGARESIGAGVIAGLKPEYEVVQFILTPEAAISEIPLIARGQKPATSSSSIGTGNISEDRRPVAVITGGAYSEGFDELRAKVEGQFDGPEGSGLVWLKHDGSKPAPVPGTPEYGKVIIDRTREALGSVEKKGVLGSGKSEVHLY